MGLILAALGALAQAPAPDPPAEPPPGAVIVRTNADGTTEYVYVQPETVVVTATLTEREPFLIPTAVTVQSQEAIERIAPLSVVDALADRVGIWVEKRTGSTSDPLIRGLSGSNLLALVDGDTLSTFWGEGGDGADDMYGKVDAENVERIEVVRGPRSVLYGSNALGGVLNFLTRSCPYDFTAGAAKWGAELRPSVASAAGEARFREEVFGATRRFRFILGGSLRSAGDMRRGGGGREVPTSGREHNWDFKADWKLPAGLLTFSVQDVQRRQVHRYYRPDQDNDNDRLGLSLQYAGAKARPAWDALFLKAYYQSKEDRRRFYTQGWQGVARTRTWQLQGRAEKKLGPHALVYGLSYERDLGESADDEQWTLTFPDGTVEKGAPDTTWQGLGLFVQDEWETSRRTSFTWALRADRFAFDSDPDSLYRPAGGWDPARDRLRERKTSLIGSAGFLFKATDRFHIVANWGRGYRLWAPQFGVTQRGVGVVVPSGLLDPVVGDTYEVGLKCRSASWELNAFGYYSRFRNWQTVVPATFAGSDWYDYNGNGVPDTSERVYVTASVGSAWLQGFEVEGVYRFAASREALSGFSVGGGFATNQGRVDELGEPMRYTQPPAGRLFVEWSRSDLKHKPYLRCGAEIVGRYDRIAEEFLLDDPCYRSDPQDGSSPLVRPYGVPGYTLFNLRGGLALSERVGLRLSVDNAGDKLCRRAQSRWDEPGINVMVSLRIRLGE